MSDLAIVVVSWNVRDLLRRCLRAVEASLAGSGISYEIVVVDNASADGSSAMLRAEFPHARLIEPGANLGFAGGNNVALRTLLTGATPYILLLNPDTEPVGDAIPRLLRWLEAHPALIAVGPQLRYADGSLQPSRRRFPSRATLFWESTVLDRLWPGNPWACRYRCADTPATIAQPVGWLVGAALLVRTETIRRAGLLDERFFMYSEELEWEDRLQQAAAAAADRVASDDRSRIADRRTQRSTIAARQSCIWYLPEAVVIHHEGRSSEQAVARRQIDFNRSKILLARMWYGWALAWLLHTFLRLGFAYELTVEAVKLLLRHRPDLRRRRIALYWHVLHKL